MCLRKIDIIWDVQGVWQALVSFEMYKVYSQTLVSLDMDWVFIKKII